MNNNDTTTKRHKDLYTTNCEYDPELNLKLRLLYQGGFEIQKNADLFLMRLDNLETAQAFEARKKSVSYIPYLSEFSTQFSASLFSEQLEVKIPADANDESTVGEDTEDPFYKLFIENCDGNGKSIHQFMWDVFDKALYELKVYVGRDFPKKPEDMPINNLYEEEALGLANAYTYTIPYENVIDWKIDPRTGKFIWLKIFNECFPDDDPLLPATHYYEFKIWKLVGEGKDKKGGWESWQSERMPINKSYNTITSYTLKESGITSFPEIPIDCFYIPKGYHVGLQIGSICQEHYQRRSFLVSNANKTCVALGVVKLGPEIGAPGDAVPADIPLKQEPSDLRHELETDGWTVIRDVDSVEIIEAKGEAHKFVSEELKHLVEQMMQTLRQMNMTARANMKNLARSAASKLVDQHGTSMLLSVYDRLVKDFVKKFFAGISAGRKESIHWSIEGLSTSMPVVDREALVNELSKLGVDIFKFPDLFKSKYIFKSAMELLDNEASDKEKLELQEKIEEAVEAGQFEPVDAAKQLPQSTMAQSNPGNTEDNGGGGDEPMAMGPSGQPLLPDGSHLQTGEHVDARTIFNQLAEDYDEKDIQFVLHIPWIGPVEVPLSSIDFSNKDNWQASQPEDEDHVDMFADKMKNENYSKPIILFNNPSNDNKMMVGDGHHRALAALKNNQPVNAYVGLIGSDRGPWDKMHSKQIGSKESSNQKERSDQKETSVQKEASNQVSKSEKAVGGKTK